MFVKEKQREVLIYPGFFQECQWRGAYGMEKLMCSGVTAKTNQAAAAPNWTAIASVQRDL